MSEVLRQVPGCEDEQRVPLFYAERVLELMESDYRSLARHIFITQQAQFSKLLKPDHLTHLETSTSQTGPWTKKDERTLWQRMQNAWAFGEYKTVHDCGHEILLRQDETETLSETFTEKVKQLLAANNAHYIEPDEVAINTFVDARIEFLVENRTSRSAQGATLQGNPGFYLRDALGRRFRCFVKQVDETQVGDKLHTKITNIPGLVLSSNNVRETILYLEPRIAPGDIIHVELNSLSHSGNSFTFRHLSYDGFLWFKRRGVNKEVFNRKSLRPNDRIIAKVLYTSDEEKRASNGNITRLGLIKAIPVRRAGTGFVREASPDTGAAKVLN